MVKSEKYNKLIKEKMYNYRLQNGVNCYIIPKKEYADMQAMVIYNYGSVDTEFIHNNKLVRTPNGIAHFLEHKLFENEEGNAFLEFTKNAANVNAYTNYTNTAYYFNCIDRFYENLNLLFNMVKTPHFTLENIEKEKGIISEEIKMYEDNPFWKTYVNMQKGMYFENPVRNEITGDLDDIQSISKYHLDLCYDKFYNNANMAIIATGNIDQEKLAEIVESHFSSYKACDIKPSSLSNLDKINSNLIEVDMNIAVPMFHIGFRDYDFTTDINLKIASSKIAADILTGESTSWYQNLYNKHILDSSFSRDYNCDMNSFGSTIFSGYSNDVNGIVDNILKRVDFVNNNGIDDISFNRVKRKFLGRLIRGFNSIDTITNAVADLHSKNTDIFDLIDTYEKIQKSDVRKRIKEHFKEDNMVVSVANPL